MYEWQQQIQSIVDEMDECIKHHHDEALTLRKISDKLGYSEFYTTRKFREISGLRLRDYLRRRKLAFALKEVRDSERSLLDIALDYGFSSHEAFTRAFKDAFGVTPSAYRKDPRPVALRTKLNPFDRYFLGLGEIGMIKSEDDVKIYFVTIPAHKFLHIENRESNGYWDFWQKQALIPGQDSATGGFPGQSAGAYGFPWITGERCRRECCCPIFPRGSTWSLSTAPLITSRKTAPWRRRLSGPWRPLTMRPPAAAWIRRRGGPCTFITTRTSISSISGLF